MKITLLAPHQVTKMEAIPLYGGLGVLALAASVKQSRYDCEVIDLIRYHKISNVPLDHIISEIVDTILLTKSDIIGFSTISDSLVIALEISKRIKERDTDLCIVLGGPGVSYCAQEVIGQFPAIDYIIRGEADNAFPDFIKAYEANRSKNLIKGLVYMHDGEIIDSGWPDPIVDLDQLPIPAYEFCKEHDFDTSHFDRHFGFHIEAGRGCPYNCIFCSTSNYFKRKYRVKSVERLVKEICFIKEKLKNKRIRFTHDLLTFDHDYMEKLCSTLGSRFNDIRWGCDSRLDTIHPLLIEKMVKAGCDFIYLGIEAGTPRMQKIIGKGLDLSRIDQVLESLKNNNINFILSFILGFPGENISDIEATYALALKAKSVCLNKCSVQMHPLIPEIGSRLFEKHKASLSYDSDHGFMESALPSHWKELHEVIQNNPQIFVRFFRFNNDSYSGSTIITDPVKFTYFAYLLEDAMGSGLIFAYRISGGALVESLVKCILENSIAISNTADGKNFSDYHNIVRLSVINLLGENTRNAEVFDSIIKYEKAIYQAIQIRNPSSMTIIETPYTPEEMDRFISNPGDSENIVSSHHCLVIVWDEKIHHVNCIEISQELALLAKT